MRTVAQGSPLDLTVQFSLTSGQLVDPDAPHADIIAPDGSVFLADQPVIRLDVGTYKYTFNVPALADLGAWTIRWYGTVNGNTASVAEAFEVVAPSQALTTSAIVTRLRRLIGERIPIGKDETATRFTDQEIADTYYTNDEDMNKALAELWFSKAAILGDFVDMQESGAVRNLSQMAKAALAQATKYEAKALLVDQQWQATYRVPGRTFNPYRDSHSGSRLLGAVVIFADPQRAWTSA